MAIDPCGFCRSEELAHNVVALDVVADRFDVNADGSIACDGDHDAIPSVRQIELKLAAFEIGFPIQIDAKRNILRFRSEEHTSELQSRVDISYAVFCLKKK